MKTLTKKQQQNVYGGPTPGHYGLDEELSTLQ